MRFRSFIPAAFALALLAASFALPTRADGQGLPVDLGPVVTTVVATAPSSAPGQAPAVAVAVSQSPAAPAPQPALPLWLQIAILAAVFAWEAFLGANKWQANSTIGLIVSAFTKAKTDADKSLRLLLVLSLGCMSLSGCQTIGPVICGQGKVLVPPDAKVCTSAILAAAEGIPGAVAACAVEVASAACIDSIIAAGANLVACEPTCGPGPVVAGRRGAGGEPVKVSASVLRTNMFESLNATGTHGSAASAK